MFDPVDYDTNWDVTSQSHGWDGLGRYLEAHPQLPPQDLENLLKHALGKIIGHHLVPHWWNSPNTSPYLCLNSPAHLMATGRQEQVIEWIRATSVGTFS